MIVILGRSWSDSGFSKFLFHEKVWCTLWKVMVEWKLASLLLVIIFVSEGSHHMSLSRIHCCMQIHHDHCHLDRNMAAVIIAITIFWSAVVHLSPGKLCSGLSSSSSLVIMDHRRPLSRHLQASVCKPKNGVQQWVRKIKCAGPFKTSHVANT